MKPKLAHEMTLALCFRLFPYLTELSATSVHDRLQQHCEH